MKRNYNREYKLTPERKVLRKYSYRLAMSIVRERKRRWLTQSELAQEVGIPQTVISYLESGWANPSLYYLIKLAEHFKKPLADFLKHEQ